MTSLNLGGKKELNEIEMATKLEKLNRPKIGKNQPVSNPMRSTRFGTLYYSAHTVGILKKYTNLFGSIQLEIESISYTDTHPTPELEIGLSTGPTKIQIIW